jgi:hypothetical protein
MKRAFLIAISLLVAAPAHATNDHPLLRAQDVLRCLHPEGAHYQRVVKLTNSWDQASIYGADSSEVDRIFYSGAVSYHPYALDAAVIWRKGMVRLVIVGDTAPLPPNTNCALLNWQG